MTFSRHYLAQRATLDAVDLAEVQGCRRAHNQLGLFTKSALCAYSIAASP